MLYIEHLRWIDELLRSRTVGPHAAPQPWVAEAAGAVPDGQRLACFAREWLDLLRNCLPGSESTHSRAKTIASPTMSEFVLMAERTKQNIPHLPERRPILSMCDAVVGPEITGEAEQQNHPPWQPK